MDSKDLLTYVNRNCPHLDRFLCALEPNEKGELTRHTLASPNPRATAGRIEDLLATEAEATVKEILGNGELRKLFLATVGGSRYLFSVLRRNSPLIREAFILGGSLGAKTLQEKEEDLRERLAGAKSVQALNRGLRNYKDEEYLRLGCRDLAGLADVREVMRELSDLATACIRAALEFHWQRLRAKHGLPPGLKDRFGFVVMGLGKIAGGELNFSSDVDLIFLRLPEQGATDGPEPVPVAGFYESLARSMSQSLSEVTDDSFVFRVDLRLRPEGERGEMVPSLSAALEYYWAWGRTWERAALMKAVPIAGDMELGKAFVKGLEPFIYRKYLDFSTIEEMREMKLRVEAQVRRKGVINIKLGQGGIREIEFFVQALQLINAGRTPQVRAPGTLEALRLLREAGLLESGASDALTDAYLFFRKTEHRIQINHQLQTHELPRTPEEQEELARRMGYANHALQEFMADLDRRRKTVEELFTGMFHATGEEILEQCAPWLQKLVDFIPDEDASIQILHEHGFEDALESYPILRGLLAPKDRRIFPDKARLMLERLAPLLVDELSKTPEPSQTTIVLDRYISSLQTASGYFSTLLENPPTARFLVKILGESRFFSELLIRHPQAIDSLIARWAAPYPEDKSSVAERLWSRLDYYQELEARLDVLRIFKNEQILRIGVSHLAGDLDSAEARRLVTELAEACLGAAVKIAADEMWKKFGSANGLSGIPFVIVGMGKLGGMEMTYLSDVDVIFIYDPPAGPMGRLSAHEWFTRLAQRVISVLSVPTSEGTVFAIDTRLRPSGNKGPLVTTLDGFREYHATTSQLWEKQALIKARPVAGPADLCEDVARIVKDCVLRTSISQNDLVEIARLRERMEDELAQEDNRHVDLKTGHGGLVDVEFYVQAKILMHANQRPDVLRQNTLESLSALKEAGLVDDDSFKALDSGYRFLTNLEDRLRIMEHRSVNRLPLEGEKLKGLARRLGYEQDQEQRFLDDYFRITGAIRGIYNSLFGREQSTG
ncbi:MAG: bifunctional [glutamate--ammonia ligase]-adenylyl-L-tyrosine phosphorylase/[glutamate--ammonia-ligase] adenylyltransferase [Deltaproteobacteria bacterium]|nr:bifunctional [glutamate--ammonia ligase]-adenylyl-L-tyrosine phosphorylase/[glutamate--ammonia-ligase] adenylyltransferase [Deltaproteobacteria bacterium]